MIGMAMSTTTMVVPNMSCAVHLTFSYTEYIEESIVLVKKTTDVEI
jgi:hypothetical protein